MEWSQSLANEKSEQNTVLMEKNWFQEPAFIAKRKVPGAKATADKHIAFEL